MRVTHRGGKGCGRLCISGGVAIADMYSATQRSVERLVASCESLVSGKGEFEGKEWKLSQYVIALRQQVTELERSRSVDQDTILLFQQKVTVLEDVVCQRKPLMKRASSLRGAESRAELFAQSTDGGSGLRNRRSSAAVVADSSSEAAMERQRRNQENIAEEMMDIARSLKNNAIAAKTIIVNDNRVLKKTNEKAEQNITSLDKQTGRVKEHSRGCPWGTILLLVIVFTVFLVMIFIIRVVPKPSV